MGARGENSVAVIVPCFNGERFLRRALDSVRAQTLAPDEIFVVDDGSTDRTLEILAAEYPEARVISQARGGPAKARNRAMQESTAGLIAFLDADDWWQPEKLARQVAALERQPEAVANYTGLRVVREADGVTWDEVPLAPEKLWPGLRWRNPSLPPACVMVRRAAALAVGGFDERQVGSEDWALWFRLRQRGPFCVCSEPLTCYRSSPGGLSGDADHMFGDFMRLLEGTLLDGLTGLRRWIWRRRIVSYQAFRASMTARGAGDRATERRYMGVSWRMWPSPFWIGERGRAAVVTYLRR